MFKLYSLCPAPSTFITSFFSHLLYASKMGTLEDSIRGGDGPLIGNVPHKALKSLLPLELCIAIIFMCTFCKLKKVYTTIVVLIQNLNTDNPF